VSDTTEMRQHSGVDDTDLRRSASMRGPCRSRANVARDLLEHARANRALADHLEKQALQASGLRDEAHLLERTAKVLFPSVVSEDADR
jgi:hypothetical protein